MARQSLYTSLIRRKERLAWFVFSRLCDIVQDCLIASVRNLAGEAALAFHFAGAGHVLVCGRRRVRGAVA
jgi:hypothetical protein